MKKEIVSQNDIIMDIHNYCIYDLKRLVFPFVITLLWTIALIIIALFFPWILVKIFIIGSVIVTLLITLNYLLKNMNNILQIKNSVKNGDYKITLDTLESTDIINELSTTESLFMLRGITSKMEKPYRMKFRESGEFILPTCYNYIWSTDFTMSGAGIFASASKGDLFYLVKDGNKIVMVYNANYFQIQ